MAAILSFGRHVPERVLGNEELARSLGCEAEWILRVSGVEQRRVAGAKETVADLAVAAAQDCLQGSGAADNIGLVIVASGSAERRFPGPAAEIAHRLGLPGVPAIDLPIASAGSLFGLALAEHLAGVYGTVLVVAAEKMSDIARSEPLDKNVAILFGDGAGACLIGTSRGLEIVDSVLHSDGAHSEELRLEFSGPIKMNGLAVIRHATHKIPAVIEELLKRNVMAAGEIHAFLMHQANRNLIDRVANSIGVPGDRFYSNIGRYGNTSSASLLIAAAEWHENVQLAPGDAICMAAFGAGFHWGALLARQA